MKIYNAIFPSFPHVNIVAVFFLTHLMLYRAMHRPTLFSPPCSLLFLCGTICFLCFQAISMETERKIKLKTIMVSNLTFVQLSQSGQLAIVCQSIRTHRSPLVPSTLNFSTCLIPLYVLPIKCHASPNKFFQLESSNIVLGGHHDSVNAVKFDADLSMLLSGGKSFV